MDTTSFIRRNKPAWAELEALLAALGKRKARADAGQLDRFAELYRTASAHLAYLQTYAPASETTALLNDLVSRSHNQLHAGGAAGQSRPLQFMLYGFPMLIKQRLPFVLLAGLLFGFGGVLGYLAIGANPAAIHAVLPAGMADGINPALVNSDRGDLNSAIMSAEIMTNNIRVAALAFISGVTLGFLTLYLMVFNGLLIGALAAVFAQAGYTYTFWAYILPHGVIELLAIFIAGGAGFYMGYSFFVPGELPRRLQFIRSAKESALLLLGTLPLFVIAGLIEGYITPATLPLWLKYCIAGLTLAACAAYYWHGTARGPKAGQSGGGMSAAFSGKGTT
ncbi:stage II sporulation protein M [Paenibacillus pasadenensis]|uniref:stage II sporulation protein M n=1 Tax=Paenibacillus pasadenensis TaxID=217090 RepID=UPI00203ABFDF|nr:stage II sporulation protein M [Paenibacillus pasadenensis]MCM3748726.1 stage II sporulation protein M [Paenibacillus pasadenensis]